MSNAIQVVLAGFFVAVLGLPHGALDLHLTRHIGREQARGWHLAAFIGYVVTAALALVFWLQAPSFALIVFLAMSAWHFAGDWQDTAPLALRVAAGAGIVTIPALSHRDEVGNIFEVLLGADGQDFAAILASAGVALLPCIAVMAIVSARRHPKAVFEILAVSGIALMLPPLVFFTLYFCGLHSPRHLSNVAERLNLNGFWALMKAVAPATLVVIVAAFALFFFVPSLFSTRFLTVIFAGLFALTVPHMLVIHFASKRLPKSRCMWQGNHSPHLERPT